MCFRPPSVSKPKRCPACGAMNAGIVQTCRKCGSAFPELVPVKVTCPRCGADNPDTAAACAQCGLTMEEAGEFLKAKAAANNNNLNRGEMK